MCVCVYCVCFVAKYLEGKDAKKGKCLTNFSIDGGPTKGAMLTPFLRNWGAKQPPLTSMFVYLRGEWLNGCQVKNEVLKFVF